MSGGLRVAVLFHRPRSCPCHVLRSRCASFYSGLNVLLTAELHSDEVLEAQVLQEHSWRSTSLEVEGDVRGELCLQRGEVEVGRLLVERRCIPYRLWKEKTDESLFAIPCLQFINTKNTAVKYKWRNLMKHDMWSATSASSVDFREETGSKLWYLVSKFTPACQSTQPPSWELLRWYNNIAVFSFFNRRAQPLFTARGPLSGKHLYKSQFLECWAFLVFEQTTSP